MIVAKKKDKEIAARSMGPRTYEHNTRVTTEYISKSQLDRNRIGIVLVLRSISMQSDRDAKPEGNLLL